MNHLIVGYVRHSAINDSADELTALSQYTVVIRSVLETSITDEISPQFIVYRPLVSLVGCHAGQVGLLISRTGHIQVPVVCATPSPRYST